MILGQVNLKPDAVLGLATGGSPVGAYKKIVEAYNNGEVDFSGVTTINLDEYRGIKRNHEQSYWSFMQENLFKHVNVREDHIFIPNGENLNSEEVCREYDKIIENAGGIDMQLLGIGLDGHIGFNEPADHFEKNTHCVELTESTIEANKRFLRVRMKFRVRHIPWDPANRTGKESHHDRKWKKQGGYHQKSIYRTGHTGSPGIHSADASGFHTDRR